jgi:hypothetical protein
MPCLLHVSNVWYEPSGVQVSLRSLLLVLMNCTYASVCNKSKNVLHQIFTGLHMCHTDHHGGHSVSFHGGQQLQPLVPPPINTILVQVQSFVKQQL